MKRKNLILIIFYILATTSCKVIDKKEYSPQYKKIEWQQLNTEAYRGKQDDISFVDENNGWYVNGSGKIYHTADGGKNWIKQIEKKGTFFRTIAFINKQVGFAGTVGTEYFPNVTDTIPLYGTRDGGNTWNPVAYKGPYVKGLCAINVVKKQFINHGEIGYKNFIYAVGRVGGPANIMISHDNGTTWLSKSMSSDCGMLLDIKMLNKMEGIACASSNADTRKSNALILRTSDGGNTWRKVYQSKRLYENCWKVHFPSKNIGYATIQSYDPNPEKSQQRFIKTTDGGKSWKEFDLVNDKKARSFGVGFINNNIGFIGTMNSGYKTIDGGKSWTSVNLGRACNKIKIYRKSNNKIYGYAIGVNVFKLNTNYES